MHSRCVEIDGCTSAPYCQGMADKGAHLEAHYQELLQQEIAATQTALRSLSRVVDDLERRVAQWADKAPGGAMDQLFVLETIQDLGRLKQRSDAAIKQLAVHAVRDRSIPASTVARELGVAHTTVARWAEVQAGARR